MGRIKDGRLSATRGCFFVNLGRVLDLSNRKHCFLSFKYEENQSNQLFLSFVSSISWVTVSKALLKSNHTLQEYHDLRLPFALCQ